ncbi:hypothetical protein Golomagni_05368 [Golovinomyces magnicellulatus]|nr:hypothetical protein Golomagni_05368 [Golovinomyces magnicellulatus]
MRILKSSEIARRLAQATNDAKNAISIKKKRPKRPELEHGQQIFIFSHIQKKMVAYSLTRALNNSETLRHIPFNGKKTVPSALRKDLWSPFATITLPEGYGPVGLSILQKLREYRKRHEHEWGDEIAKNPENGYFIAKKKRERKICDQVANSVADIAYVLGRLKKYDAEQEEELIQTKKPFQKRPRKSIIKKPNRSLKFPKPPPGGIGLVGEGKGIPIQIQWRDIQMAEYAESWSENVEHGLLPWSKNNRQINDTKQLELANRNKERKKLFQMRVIKRQENPEERKEEKESTPLDTISAVE